MAVQISGAIFLHIPKTGGSWVRDYFRDSNMVVCELEPEHINGKVIREIRNCTEDLIFTFVRHPLTWYRSYWQMRQNDPTDRAGKWIDTIVDLPFREFIETVIRESPGYLSNFYEDFVSRCRAIGKQENLRKDLDQILKLLRIPYNRESIFTRPASNVISSTEKYSYELALKLMQSEIEIIKRFNYLYIPQEVI